MLQMAVDNFMQINNRFCLIMPDFVDRHSTRSARSFIPSLSLEEHDDLYGLGEQDIEMGFSVILPKGGYDKPMALESAHSHVQRHPFSIEIISECACDDPYKVKHHPDYNFPNRVVLLCRKCHGREHAKINEQNKKLLISAIAVKMFLIKSSRRKANNTPAVVATGYDRKAHIQGMREYGGSHRLRPEDRLGIGNQHQRRVTVILINLSNREEGKMAGKKAVPAKKDKIEKKWPDTKFPPKKRK